MELKDLELMHTSIHADHRQQLSDLHWELVQSRAREKVKDRIIAELMEELTAPKPSPEA